MKSTGFCVLFFFFVFSFFLGTCDAVQRPAVALFDDNRREIMSFSTWREIDFGGRSAIAGGQRPARVFALLATLPFVANRNTATDANKAKDLFLIPYCSSTATGAAAASGNGDGEFCSLSHFLGYVLLRFRGGWEQSFSAMLWQDPTLTTDVQKAVRHFRHAANDTTMRFPLFLNDSQSALFDSGLMHRVEFIESCNDLTDECFQGNHMTYTRSFKEIPSEGISGRMIFPVVFAGAWNSPWTLRLSAAMPHDSSTVVEILVVLIDKRVQLSWTLWLGLTPLGNIVVVVACLLVVVLFVLGLKELGFRRFESLAMANGRNVTVLYAEDVLDDRTFLPLYRLMLAFREVFLGAVSPLLAFQRAFYRGFCSWPLRQWTERCPNVDTGDVILEGGRERNFVAHGHPNNANMESIAMETADNSGDNSDTADDNEDEFVCRICYSKRPVEELFAPCACDGFSKYVHQSCLEKWRATTTNAEHRRVCAECKSPYALLVERVTVSPGTYFNSVVCLPVCRHYLHRGVILLFFIFQLWAGGYYVKLCAYLFTGMDEGVVWSAANLYHWVLGVYSIIALSLNMWALEYVLHDFCVLWQQLLLLFLSIGIIEVLLAYVGQVFLSRVLNTPWSWEVSYGLGILVTATFSVTLLPHMYVVQQSLSTVREVVAPRLERAQSRTI